MFNHHRTRRAATLIAAVVSCLLIAGCGTAQTNLTDDETVDQGPARCPGGQELKGAGSTAQHNAIDHVAATYEAVCDDRVGIHYEATDSEAAISTFLAGTVDWAGSETLLTQDQQAAAADRCTAGEARSLPLVAGSVAIVVNLPGVDQLTLSTPVLGKIFDGGVTRWNDPAIADLNPGLPLPDGAIDVVAREDQSGLTAGLTRYLADNGAWPADKVGEEWAGTGERLGRAAVLATLRGTPNSIGYVELSAARDNGLTVARIDSGAGPVELTAESAAAGLARAEMSERDGELRLTPNYVDAPAGAYPLQIVSYQIVCTTGLTPRAKTLLLKDFLGFLASDPQQAALGELGYTPLPESARGPVRDAIAQLR
ncbi:substrate-binding domain-containing protein [Granulicoccus sp. GXG6511]|uniref:substrate-binding domain-containing protein n=1 Tax=Granulicoccus sp. GXG6511 TaxID=3381351 RepID=UPI003D7CA741